MVHVALAAVEANGVDAEVIDLRTLIPLDIETIEESVKKTGRCLVVQEATKTSGFGAELAALVQERCFYHLEAPVERVAGWDTPYPHAYEWIYFPGPIRMKNAIQEGHVRMSTYKFKLPDIGEGIAEAEIVAWHVKVGDVIGEDQQLADMMTDKATVEMESPVAGTVTKLAGEVGDQIAIGRCWSRSRRRATTARPRAARTSRRSPTAPRSRPRRRKNRFRVHGDRKAKGTTRTRSS